MIDVYAVVAGNTRNAASMLIITPMTSYEQYDEMCNTLSHYYAKQSTNRFYDGVDRSLQKGTAFAELTSGCIITVPKGLRFGDVESVRR